MQGKKDFQEKLFTNFLLSDRIPDDNFYRQLKQVIDLRFVQTATRKYYGAEGQQSIDPVVFFKLMLVGWSLHNLHFDYALILFYLENLIRKMELVTSVKKLLND